MTTTTLRSEQLHSLAKRVEQGTPINGPALLNAMAITQVAHDAEYAERIDQRWQQRAERLQSQLDKLHRVDTGGSAAEPGSSV